MAPVKLTSLAEDILLETVVGAGIPKGKGLRVEESEKGLTLTTDTPTENDRLITRDSRILIIIGKEVEEKIGEATIDIKRVKGELKLLIIRDSEELIDADD